MSGQFVNALLNGELERAAQLYRPDLNINGCNNAVKMPAIVYAISVDEVTSSFRGMLNYLLTLPQLDINAANEDGYTAAHAAVRFKSPYMLRFLLDRFPGTLNLNGIYHEDGKALTALDLAERHLAEEPGYPAEIVQILHTSGAKRASEVLGIKKRRI